jgi:eukaryotic-like serine/threonine-protein kinase
VFKFLTNRPFWVNLLAAIFLAFLFVFLFLKMLGWITKHGDTRIVPAVTGKKTAEAIKLLESKGFEVQIQDSVYTDTLGRGIVIKQLPEGNATVKSNRIVFITVNRVIPPSFDMPKLEGQSLSAALDILERNHLVLEDTLFKPDFMKGYVLEQVYKGNRIPAGAKVQWGSKITLVIASGLEGERKLVPDVLGMTFAEAKALLEAEGIILSPPIASGIVKDTAGAFVVKQSPPRFTEDEKLPNYIQPGQVMDIWISASPDLLVTDSSNKKKPKTNE